MTLKVDSLSFERQWILLFEGLSFQLQSGTLLQVQGANGSGKTTLLRMLAGFIEPTSGKILWQNHSISKNRELYQENLAYLGHLNGLKLHLTVAENLKLISALLQIKYETSTAEAILFQLGLCDEFNKTVKNLSMGQQRRLSYARLLLSPKKIWLLDEPTTGLDREGQDIFTELLKMQMQQGGMAVVSTHHELSENLAPKVLQLGGRHD